MARLTALPNGQPWQFFRSAQELLLYTVDPAATLFVDFDESTNAALVADLPLNMASYSVPSSGVLQKNGQAVTIAAQSALYQIESAILTGFPDATIKAAVVALWNGNATAQTQQRALAYCLLKLHQSGVI